MRNSLIIFCIALGLWARLLICYFSFGTVDVLLWERFSTGLENIGFLGLYETDKSFNHPPIGALLVWLCYFIAENTPLSFSFCLRLPGVLAEFGTAFLLYKIWLSKASSSVALVIAALFACSPVSILATGFHGNLEGVYTLLCLLAFYFLTGPKNAFLAGLLLASAVNIKIVPIILLPAALSCCLDRREIYRFLLGFVLGALPLIVAFALFRFTFLESVLFYVPTKDYWGIQMFLLLGSLQEGSQAALFEVLFNVYQEISRFLILGSITALSIWKWKTQKLESYEIAALSFALFAIFAPAFELRYFVCLIPLLFAFSCMWGVRIAIFTGVALFANYLTYMEDWEILYVNLYTSAPKTLIIFLFVAWLSTVALVLERLLLKGKL